MSESEWQYPVENPFISGLEIHGRTLPAKRFGGDYYDLILHSGNQDDVTVVIGDLAADEASRRELISATRSLIRAQVNEAKVSTTTTDLVCDLNTTLCAKFPTAAFMTLNLGTWNSASNTFKFTGAGHEHLLVYRSADSSVECIKAGGIVMGLVPEANEKYHETSVRLEAGDLLVLYSDGVIETTNEAKDYWGLDTLTTIVKAHADRTPEDIVDAILKSLQDFRGHIEQEDDLTLIAMKAKAAVHQSVP